MHEFSIAENLLSLVIKYAKQNKAKKITKVEIEIGKLSGVEVSCLETAFNALKSKTIASQAQFIISLKDIVIICKSCQKESTLEKFIFQCPICNGFEVEILQGNDMILKSIEVEDV